jgi:hypothetical protein
MTSDVEQLFLFLPNYAVYLQLQYTLSLWYTQIILVMLTAEMVVTAPFYLLDIAVMHRQLLRHLSYPGQFAQASGLVLILLQFRGPNHARKKKVLVVNTKITIAAVFINTYSKRDR